MNTEETQTPQDQPGQQEQSESAPPETPASPESSGVDSKEVEEGRTFAILSYALNCVFFPFFVVPLIMRKNEFALYHAKQCLLVWLAGLACGLLCSIPLLGCLALVISPLAFIFLLVLNIMGLINAVKAEQKPLPLIGKWGEEWFKGLRKV